MNLAIDSHPQGAVFQVQAHAGARKQGIQGAHDGAVKVAVTAAPEKGKANRALVAVLSQALGLRKSQFELIAGSTSSRKRFLVRGVDADDLAARLGRQLPPHSS